MAMIDRWMNSFVVVSINLTMGMIAFLVIMQVTFRFVINNPLPWPEELSRLLFIYLVFIGGAASSRDKTHISIDLIDNILPSDRVRRCLALIRNLLTAVVLSAAAYGAWTIIPNIQYMRLPATGLPMNLMIIPVFVGSVLMLMWTVGHALQDLLFVINGHAAD